MFIICQPEIDFLTKKYKINTYILRYFAVFLPSQMTTILIFLNIQIKLISFSPEKMSKAEKYSFRDCFDENDLSALKARFEKALEMPEFSMFMVKMND